MLINETESAIAESQSDGPSSATVSAPPSPLSPRPSLLLVKPIVDLTESDPIEVPTDNPADAPVHDVRCGLLTAKLHMQRFTCPGIHRRCIEYGGRMITPREFTIQAEKDKQKDWKGSIRFGRHNLRSMMENKSLDFYHHETNCSLKCQSRNYIKNRKSEAMESSFTPLDSTSESRNSNLMDHNDENGDYLKRKRSSVLEDYMAQTIQSLNNNPLSRLIKTEDHHHLKSEDQISSYTTTSGSSTSPSVSSPQSHSTHPTSNVDFHSAPLLSGSTTLPGQSLPPESTSQLLQHFLDQQLLIQQQPQPQQQLLSNLLQVVNKSQSPTDTNALIQMAMVAMQMNQQQHLNTQPNPMQQLLLAQNLNALNGNVGAFGAAAAPLPPQTPQQPYINEAMFSVANIRKVMESEPQLFWSRMRELGVLDELLDSITLALERIRSLYAKRDSNSDEEEFAARKLSGLANMLDLGAVFREKIHSRFIQTALESSLISKELQMAIALQQKDVEQKLKMEAAKRRQSVFDAASLINSSEPEMKKMRIA